MNTQNLPTQIFFRTQEQRTALAREQFFEDGIRPSGLVSETVIQSWDRCRQLGQQRDKLPALDPVGRAALSTALARNEKLMQAARLELDQLQTSLSGTHCRVLLTDERGVIMHVSQDADEANQTVLDKVSRVGVNVTESRLGTAATGIVVHTGHASQVKGGEHFYNPFRELQCAAAPIRDIHGQLAGVLNLSTEAHDFGFDPAAVVGLFATMIGNRLQVSQSPELLVLHFQTVHSLLGTPMEGLMGIDTNGRVIWVNRVGHSLLGVDQQVEMLHVNDVLGIDLHALVGLYAASQRQQIKLPSGLSIWVKAFMQGSQGASNCHLTGASAAAQTSQTSQMQASATLSAPPLKPSPSLNAEDCAPLSPAAQSHNDCISSLAQSQQRLIGQTLIDQHGNVAKTARLLGVSRGLVYRHMRKDQADKGVSSSSNS